MGDTVASLPSVTPFVPVRMYSGETSRAQRQAIMRESTRHHDEYFAQEYGYDPESITAMCEAFTGGRHGFSFLEIERNARAVESAAGRVFRNREAITTSQAAAAISLVIVHQIIDAYAQQPAIFRELAEIETSNGDSEVYPEEFMDDIPVRTGETEPAPESRMGAGVVRIKNYQYTRALVISKRYFDLDKTGQTRRFANEFGSKYPIAQDRAFLLGIFLAGQYQNMTTNGGIIPPTNIAGGLTLAGAAYTAAGVVGIPDGYNPAASQMTPAAIEDALLAPALFTDPYGVEIGTGIEFDTLLCDSIDRFKAKRFVQSNVNPVQLLQGDTTGQAPGAFSDNVLKGEFTVASHPYVRKTRAPLSGKGYPWAMMQKGKSGAVMQIEKEWEVNQEMPLAGKSFDESTLRWRGSGWFGSGLRSGRRIYIAN